MNNHTITICVTLRPETKPLQRLFRTYRQPLAPVPGIKIGVGRPFSPTVDAIIVQQVYYDLDMGDYHVLQEYRFPDADLDWWVLRFRNMGFCSISVSEHPPFGILHHAETAPAAPVCVVNVWRLAPIDWEKLSLRGRKVLSDAGCARLGGLFDFLASDASKAIKNCGERTLHSLAYYLADEVTRSEGSLPADVRGVLLSHLPRKNRL